MNDQRLVFLGAGSVAVETFDPGPPGPGQVTIRTVVTAVSAGTESLLWRGTWPEGMSLDGLWAPESDGARYPVGYGYASVGQVEALGAGVDQSWQGQWVFTFTGHQTRAVVPVEGLVALPPGLLPEDAVFVAALETALSLAQDAAPVVGETVGVWGLGTIGVLTAACLAGSFRVQAWDAEVFRRQLAAGFMKDGLARVAKPSERSCDVVIELTGNPLALDEALSATRYSGRVVVGSWYGARPVPLSLGGEFHRSHIEMVASQVSLVSPRLSGRWSKARRWQTVLTLAAELRPSRLVTHRFGLDQAAEAYRQACDNPADGLQVLFTYD